MCVCVCVCVCVRKKRSCIVVSIHIFTMSAVTYNKNITMINIIPIRHVATFKVIID